MMTTPTVEAEQPDTPEVDETSATNETTPEQEAPVQPAEIDEQAAEIAEGGKAIELHTPHGHLTLRPNQDQLDPGQHAGLLAIGIDVKQDPGVWPHLRVFIHMCQRKDLDPYAREAYLIGRGRGEKRRWTMQTSIDGYRKMAGMTGRFVRVAGTYWTWQDDNDESWWQDPEGIMRRRWFDQWPDSREHPGAARVVIEHYDEARRLTRTEAVGNWGMFAPYTDKYEGTGQNRRLVRDAGGNAVKVLGEFWQKGGPHMLSKCTEALGHRQAFPAGMGGFYVQEEMSRLDQAEQDRQTAELARKRTEAMQAAQTREQITVTGSTEPVRAGEVAQQVVEQVRDAHDTPAQDAAPDARVDDETRAAWLRAEIEEQARILDTTVAALTTRQVRAARKNSAAELTVTELASAAHMMREMVTAELRKTGRNDEADAYALLEEGQAAPLDLLFGRTAAGDDEVGEDLEPDARAAHEYVDNEGSCEVCGRFRDESPHPGATVPTEPAEG